MRWWLKSINMLSIKRMIERINRISNIMALLLWLALSSLHWSNGNLYICPRPQYNISPHKYADIPTWLDLVT